MPAQINSVFSPFPPSRDTGSNVLPMLLSGTGTAESSTPKLTEGRSYTISVGAVPVRLSFHFATGLSNAVDPTQDYLTIAANTMYTFTAWANNDQSAGALCLYAEAADGTSAYTASVWMSGN